MAAQEFDGNQVYQLNLEGYTRENQSDATYEYIAHALPGTALATAKWRAQRITTATGTRLFADGGAFTQVATDLSALTYAV
jgi:hypothetical protein